MNPAVERQIKEDLWKDFSGLDISLEEGLKQNDPLAIKINNSNIEDGQIHQCKTFRVGFQYQNPNPPINPLTT